MENQKQTSFTFEIDNFSEKEGLIRSPKFSSGGCEWIVRVHPKGKIVNDHLSLFLHVANPESLRLGWKRLASYSFFLVNQSGKELFRINEALSELFCAQFPGSGRAKAVPLKKLQEKGFLEKNKLRVKVEVKVVEVVDQGDATGNETFDVKGFQVLYSQVISVTELFLKHPDIAANFRLKNQSVKTTYMNLLLGLIETLKKPQHTFSETVLSNAQDELMELTEAGFKVDWLKTKLDEVSLERKKDNARVQELEELIKNLKLELNKEKSKTDASDAKVLSLEQTVSDLKDVLNKQKHESAAKVLLLDQTVWGLKDEVSVLEYEVSDLGDELNKEKGKSADKVWTLQQTVLNLSAELKKEKGKFDTCDAKVLSLEQTVLSLRDDLKKEKAAACSWEVLDYADLPNDK
ncbi:unnamed protein product [Microthlaspi erraticum]|uniref:MATH domain-containing protein n=1 Tax=Microthlaspi erraticum TaxID=1685480 RepID=A0A6D2KCX7_9BRAS|nr:unnamed protein product [Microthlaspi erraticum]